MIPFKFSCGRLRRSICQTTPAHRPRNAEQGLPRRRTLARDAQKVLWIETSSKDAFTKAVESGVNSFLLPAKRPDSGAGAWDSLAKADILTYSPGTSDSDIVNGAGNVVGVRCTVSTGEQLQRVQNRTAVGVCQTKVPTGTHRLANHGAASPVQKQCRQWRLDTVVVDATDWSIIPAENLVAAFQGQQAALLVYADTAADAKTLLGALETGVDGVVLRSDNIQEITSLAQHVRERNAGAAAAVPFSRATVTSIEQLGMGDRVCVDLCSNLLPGEGLLVGNFSRALFLVHSECAESSYINSRPFRVNAGPVHAYLQAPEDRTAYLCELRSGHEVLVVTAEGATRTAIVGRCKIESRPLVLITAATDDGLEHSVIVQNAETVKLVGPALACASDCGAWRAIAVTGMNVGDEIFVKESKAARHMGISIVENINER